MLDRIIVLSAGAEIPVRGNVKRVIVRKASGGLFLRTDGSEEVEVSQGDNVQFEKVSGTLFVKNTENFEQKVVLVLASGSGGDIVSAAGAVTIANTEELNLAASDFNIAEYTASVGGVEILSASVTNRRGAIISTSGPIRISKTQGGTSFTVDGGLTHEALGALWASSDTDVTVQVLEYLN